MSNKLLLFYIFRSIDCQVFQIKTFGLYVHVLEFLISCFPRKLDLSSLHIISMAWLSQNDGLDQIEFRPVEHAIYIVFVTCSMVGLDAFYYRILPF